MFVSVLDQTDGRPVKLNNAESQRHQTTVEFIAEDEEVMTGVSSLPRYLTILEESPIVALPLFPSYYSFIYSISTAFLLISPMILAKIKLHVSFIFIRSLLLFFFTILYYHRLLYCAT